MQKRFTDNKIQKTEVRRQKSIRRILLLSLFTVHCSLLFIGCAEKSQYSYYNIYAMVEPSVIRSGIEQPPSYDKKFEDEKISIKFTIREKRVLFELKNKTDKELKILWDKASFVDTKDIPHGMVGFNNLFTDKMDKRPVQVVHAKGRAKDLIIPLENVELMEEGTWYVSPLFNLTDDLAHENRGKTFSILIPIEIDNEEINYNFKFRIEKVVSHITLAY